MKQLTTAKRCRPSSGWLSNLSIVLIKDGRVTLSCQEVSQMFDCFILFLTNHAFVILTLVFNLNMHVFFSNIGSSISDQSTAVGVLQSWLAIHFIVMLTSTQDRFRDVFKFKDYF